MRRLLRSSRLLEELPKQVLSWMRDAGGRNGKPGSGVFRFVFQFLRGRAQLGLAGFPQAAGGCLQKGVREKVTHLEIR